MGMLRFSGNWGRCWAAAIAAALLNQAFAVAVAADEPEPRVREDIGEESPLRYQVTPLSMTIQLSTPPDAPVEAKGQFTIRRRRAPPNERVYYSVEGDLRSDEGRTLPGSAVQIVGVSGEWGSENVLVLDAGQNRTNFSLRVLPDAWYDGVAWRYAGTYRGYLIPNVTGAPALEVLVQIDRYLLLDLSPREFHIVAHSGVGAYESPEPVVVTLRANHADWTVSRAFSPPRKKGKGPSDEIPLSQVRISEDDGPFVQVPEAPHVWLSGAELANPRLVVRELRLQVEVTWEELAGEYEGTMGLTLESSGAR